MQNAIHQCFSEWHINGQVHEELVIAAHLQGVHQHARLDGISPDDVIGVLVQVLCSLAEPFELFWIVRVGPLVIIERLDCGLPHRCAIDNAVIPVFGRFVRHAPHIDIAGNVLALGDLHPVRHDPAKIDIKSLQ